MNLANFNPKSSSKEGKNRIYEWRILKKWNRKLTSSPQENGP